MVARNYSDIAVATTLSSGITGADISLTVVSATGWPAAPFLLVIDADTANEEVILVGAKSGVIFSSLTRGFAGTSAVAHNASVAIKHVIAGVDIALIWTHAHSGDFADVDHANLIGVGINDHHARDHTIVGGTHTASGLTVGHALVATSAAAFGFAPVDHGNLVGNADDDHAQYLTVTRHAAIDAADHGSGISTDGMVLMSDGLGGAAWEAIIQDHGGFTGLADDDHALYHTDARAVTWHDADDHSGLSASQIVTGTLPVAQVPSLDTAKITTGIFGIARIPTGGTASTVAFGNHAHADLALRAGDTFTGLVVLSGGAAINSSTAIMTTTTERVSIGNVFIVGVRSASAPFFSGRNSDGTAYEVWRSGAPRGGIGTTAGFFALFSPDGTTAAQFHQSSGTFFNHARATTDSGLSSWRNNGFPGTELMALSSSVQNKINVQDADIDDLANRFLKLRLASWNSTLPADDGRRRYNGWIAEEVHPVLPNYAAEPDDKGYVSGIGDMSIPMAAAIHQLNRRLKVLESV